MAPFIKGMDVSSLKELEELGAKYYMDGQEKGLLEILKAYGVNSIRLRLWNDPYSESGVPYGAGTSDLNTTVELARRVLDMGFGFLLDIHYSDFWADPGKQRIPKAWRGMSVEELEAAVYDFTRSTLLTMRSEHVFPTMIQVGNELSNGLLWPYGKVPNYDNIARFINAGIRAVRSVDQEIPIMLHLDNGGNNALYREWFDEFMKRGEDFQIIGLSYYPFWHGTLDNLNTVLSDIASTYGKKVMVAETSYAYTFEDGDGHVNNVRAENSNTLDLDYNVSVQGQADAVSSIMKTISETTGGIGMFYWEPAWIPVAGSGWATPASLKYIQDPGPCGNEWANQALFDYQGNALPALALIRDFKAED